MRKEVIGNCELYCGDCMEIIPLLDKVDLTITSPPYDCLRDYNNSLHWNESVWKNIIENIYKITKIGGTVVWIVADSTVNGDESGNSFRQALYFKEIGFNLHDTMIWKKQTFTDTGSLKVRYGGVFEYMFILTKGKINTFNPIKDRKNISSGRKKHGTVRQKDGTLKQISSVGKKINNYGYRFNVWDINTEVSNKKRVHPAQFPEKLAEDHIFSWSNINDIILDPFMGSGTTGVACQQMGRKFIGIEKEPEYFDIACKRIDEASRQKDLFI